MLGVGVADKGVAGAVAPRQISKSVTPVFGLLGKFSEKYLLVAKPFADVAGKFPDHVARSLDQIIALHLQSDHCVAFANRSGGLPSALLRLGCTLRSPVTVDKLLDCFADQPARRPINVRLFGDAFQCVPEFVWHSNVSD